MTSAPCSWLSGEEGAAGKTTVLQPLLRRFHRQLQKGPWLGKALGSFKAGFPVAQSLQHRAALIGRSKRPGG